MQSSYNLLLFTLHTFIVMNFKIQKINDNMVSGPLSQVELTYSASFLNTVDAFWRNSKCTIRIPQSRHS